MARRAGLGDGRSIRLGAVPVSNSAEPLLSCSGRVRNAHLRAASFFLPDSTGAAARSQSQSGPNSPARLEPCAPPWVRSRLPMLLPASAQQRAAAAPAQERVPRRSLNGGAGWVLEASSSAPARGRAVRAAGPEARAWGRGRGGALLRRTAWDRAGGSQPGETRSPSRPARAVALPFDLNLLSLPGDACFPVSGPDSNPHPE